MNNIRDFIYDISDVILGFAIILVIVVVVGWKLSDTMDFGNEMTFSDSASTKSGQTADNSAKPSGDGASSISPTQPDNGSTSGTLPINTGASVKINIETGSTGYSIAKKLMAAGLILSTSDFITEVERLNAGSKLRAGEFVLKPSMSLEEIVKELIAKS